MTPEVVSAIIGLSLILSEIIVRRNILKDSGLIPESYENRILAFFIIGIAGIWIFSISLGLVVFSYINFNPKWFLLIGIITGLISALRNFIYWGLSDDKYIKKPALGEPIGGIGIGCLGLILFPVFGFIMGLVIKTLLN